MKKVIICYYSATGNTRLACEYIKNNLTNADVDLFHMADGEIPDFANYDFVGLSTFTDWTDAPYFVQQFIDKLPPQKNKPAFVFNTCAEMSGKTLRTLGKLARGKGFRIMAGFTLNTPESYPLMRIKGFKRDQNPKPRHMNKFNKFIARLNRHINSGSNYPEVAKIKIGFLNTVWPQFSRIKSKKDMGKKYVDQSLCIKCGKCQSGCPYQAIEIDELPTFDESKCYGCWSCFNNCPQKAIYTEKIKGRGHYVQSELYKKKLELKGML